MAEQRAPSRRHARCLYRYQSMGAAHIIVTEGILSGDHGSAQPVDGPRSTGMSFWSMTGSLWYRLCLVAGNRGLAAYFPRKRL